MKQVVFVCLGNICRSPMAEFVMKDLAKGYDIRVESRATSNWEHGNPIHPGTQRIFKRHAIAFDRQKRSQQISLKDLEVFDLIIGMDDENIADLQRLSQGKYDDKIVIFRKDGVPDPWFTSDFEETYDLVKTGCEKWLAQLLS